MYVHLLISFAENFALCLATSAGSVRNAYPLTNLDGRSIVNPTSCHLSGVISFGH